MEVEVHLIHIGSMTVLYASKDHVIEVVMDYERFVESGKPRTMKVAI